MIKVSIIVPVYNVEKYLAKCLDNLINQTLKEIEIICVNDGSTDNSLSILEDYANKDNRIQIFSQTNGGPGKARNLALDKATGKYIMFCDSDDWYELEMCQAMFQIMERENVDLTMCDCNIVELEKNSGRNEMDKAYLKLKNTGKNAFSLTLKEYTSIVLWNKILKKSLIDKYNIRFPLIYSHEDDSFILQYFSVSNSYYGLAKKLYNYVLRANTLTSQVLQKKNTKRKYERLEGMAYAYDFLIKNQLFESNKDLFLSFLYSEFICCFNLLEDNEKENAISTTCKLLENIDIPDNLHLDKKILLTLIKNNNPNLDAAINGLIISKQQKTQGIKFLGLTITKNKENLLDLINQKNYNLDDTINALLNAKQYQTKKIKFLGLTIFKKTKNEITTKYSIFGLTV